jgi:hypothetical protein
MDTIPLRLDISSSTAWASGYLPKTVSQGVGTFSSQAGALSRFGPRTKTMSPARMGTSMTTMILNGLSTKLGGLRGGLCVCGEGIGAFDMLPIAFV